MKLLIAVVFILLNAHADELKTDKIPIAYKDAQDIMAKKNIDGKAKKTRKYKFASFYIPPSITFSVIPLPEKTGIYELMIIIERKKLENLTGNSGEKAEDKNYVMAYYQGPPPREPNEPIVEFVNPPRKQETRK